MPAPKKVLSPTHPTFAFYSLGRILTFSDYDLLLLLHTNFHYWTPNEFRIDFDFLQHYYLANSFVYLVSILYKIKRKSKLV